MPIQRNFDSQATSPRPVVLCIGCQQLLRAHWQPGLAGDGHWSLTCDSDPKICDLADFTLPAAPYPPADIERYRTSGRKRRMALLLNECVQP